MKENEFLCPYCRGYLKPVERIILSARKEDGRRGMILFNPKLGEYDIIFHKSLGLEEGEKVDILCPLCHANLTDHSVEGNLAKIVMIDPNGEQSCIYFSEIVGKKTTYRITKDKKVESFGHSGEAPKF